ncbi:MAG: membrane protein insertion efficiency factor YidD [Erysipelotrichaceae bacterium]|nr:membrane protein insertion efficiency factor YidD [Erysipelotrichaceae bacterium]
MKLLIISLIRLYQKYGPKRLHDACLFEPTCSNYMLLAIEKYGVFKGTLKGLKRILRCHQPNGGVDYP